MGDLDPAPNINHGEGASDPHDPVPFLPGGPLTRKTFVPPLISQGAEIKEIKAKGRGGARAGAGRKPSHDWSAIRADYEAGSMSVAETARYHGIPVSSLRSRAAADGWKRTEKHITAAELRAAGAGRLAARWRR